MHLLLLDIVKEDGLTFCKLWALYTLECILFLSTPNKILTVLVYVVDDFEKLDKYN